MMKKEKKESKGLWDLRGHCRQASRAGGRQPLPHIEKDEIGQAKRGATIFYEH